MYRGTQRERVMFVVFCVLVFFLFVVTFVFVSGFEASLISLSKFVEVTVN